MKQTELVLNHLQTYGRINPKEAMDLYGIMRLGARIWDLKDAGIPIETAMRTEKNRYGKPVSFAEYRLAKEV